MTTDNRRTVRLSDADWRKLGNLAAHYDASRSKVIAAAVDYLAEHPDAAARVMAAALPPEQLAAAAKHAATLSPQPARPERRRASSVGSVADPDTVA